MKTSKLSLFRQYLAAVIASISVIILGTALGWPSPVIVGLLETGDPMSLTSEEVSWMVSLLYLGNVISPIPSGFMMDKLGRKMTLLILTFIPLLAWIIIYFANASGPLYTARFLSGLWSGVVTTIAPMYLAEISDPRVRGALSTLFQLMTYVGVFIEYVVGPWVSYKVLAAISGAIPLIFLLVSWYIPESPYWLLMKKKKEAAAKSLAWLQGQKDTSAIANLLANMDKAVTAEMKNKRSFKDLFAKRNMRALIIVEVLAIVQRMSGISALLAFTSTTLPPDGAGALDANGCVTIMGFVWVISVFISTFLVDSLGRKPLLLISSLGSGLAMFMAGLWFFLHDKTSLDVSKYSWVPFGSFLVFGVTYSIGLGPLASTYQGELFASNIKGIASGITAMALALTSFIMNKIYHPIERSVGMYLNFWIFSACNLLAMIFVIYYVIETKGKTFFEISEELNKSRKKVRV